MLKINSTDVINIKQVENTEGYDGHCLRAFGYYPERLPGIVDTVESINSIKDKFPEVRSDSKGPTFALTYLGTWYTLVKNLGFSEVKAKATEAAFHELYKVSRAYVEAKLKQASVDGYVLGAFGLKVRTPVLNKISWYNLKSLPRQAQAEARTAGNALGQSYGLLNNRAFNEFMNRVWDSPYRLRITSIALIHDAIYLVFDDDVEVIKFINDNLIQCMQWQELPDIQHDTVKLGAELDIFWPGWHNSIGLKNGISEEDIRATCAEGIAKYHESAPVIDQDDDDLLHALEDDLETAVD